MASLTFHDISYAQGAYNMAADKNPVIAMRMSFGYYGSKVLAYDSQAASNYRKAILTNKVPILYHFAGGGDPVKEADFFIGAVSPLSTGDIYVLDYELTSTMNPPARPVDWCVQFVERVHQKTGIWPLFYTYASMLAEHDFSPVLKNCALWVADYGVTPDGTVPTQGHPYIIHQYSDKPIDTNACFVSLDTLKKYGYHKVALAPAAVTPPSSLQSDPIVSDAAPSAPAPGSVTTPGPELPPSTTGTTTTTTTYYPPRTIKIHTTVPPPATLVDFFKGKKTYLVALFMLGTSVEKYITGQTTLSQFLTTVQGILGLNSLAVMTLRAAIAKVEAQL